MKKTLIIKLSHDVSQFNDIQIEALKAFYRTCHEGEGELSFEVLTQNEETCMHRLSRQIRAEFFMHDTPATKSEAAPGKGGVDAEQTWAGLDRLLSEVPRDETEADNE